MARPAYDKIAVSLLETFMFSPSAADLERVYDALSAAHSAGIEQAVVAGVEAPSELEALARELYVANFSANETFLAATLARHSFDAAAEFLAECRRRRQAGVVR